MTDPFRLAGRKVLFALCGFELGGAERQALHLARYLKSQGCEVVVWGHHHHKVGPERVIAECEEAGIPWAEQKFRWPCGKRALLGDGWALWRALQRERPDVILSYTPWPSVGCGLVWRWSPAKVFIWGQRDSDDLRGDPVERLAYRYASAVICNAGHEVGYLRRTLGKTRAPLFVVHNGLASRLPERTREEWRAELGIGEESPLAIMVANFRPQKHHALLLRAWRQLLDDQAPNEPQPRLVLAGAPQESYEIVLQLAEQLELLDSIRFVGHVKDVAGLLAASDVGLLISGHEGFSNSVMEYMQSGLPVVATDLPANREVLGDCPDHRFCEPDSLPGLTAQLKVALNDPDWRERVGRFNLERAQSTFSMEAMCNASAVIIGKQLRAACPGSDETS